MFDRVAGNIERFMDLVARRQEVVAGNIANANTPGFKTRDIHFQAEYQRQADGDSAQVVTVSSLQARSDGNNVHLEREARLLSENALQFSAASQLARGQLLAIRNAISSGRTG